MPILSMTGVANHAITANAQQEAAAKPASHAFKLFGADGFTFKDLLDVINPLEQLPIVGTIYRHLTGQHISPFSRILGGFLMGGPIGAAVSAVNAVVEQTSGKDLGEKVVSAFDGSAGGQGGTAQVAAAAASATQNSPRPGGWIINAAYGNRNPVAVAQTVAMQAATAKTAVPPSVRPRPGGWIINAAYGTFDAGRRQIDISA